MATNCEDVSARMMELLYGELPADARAGVDAHVAGCARCRAELEAFDRTRAVARQALDDDEAPPARARAAILKAATEHLAAQAQRAARKAVAPPRPSFWDRLRVKWTLPTFATVGAVAVLVIANRVFLNPERALDRTHEAMQKAGAPAPTAEAPAASPKAEPPATPADKAAELDRMLPPAAAAPAGGSYGETAQQGARSAAHGKKRLAPSSIVSGGGDRYGGLAKDRAGAGAAQAAAKPAAAGGKRSINEDPFADFDMNARAPRASEEKKVSDQARSNPRFAPPPPPRAAANAKQGKGIDGDKTVAAQAGSDDDTLERLDTEGARGGGGPGAPLGGPSKKADGYGSGAAQAAPAPAPRGETATKRPAPAMAASPSAPVAASSPAPPPAPVAATPRPRAKAARSRDAEDAPLAAEESDAKSEKKKASNKASTSDTLAQRAERLFAAGRWAEAAEVYRELLRRDPRNDDAEQWRRRLVAAESADLSERNASVAERRAAEKAAAKTTMPTKAKKAAPPKASAADALDQ